MTDLCSFHFSSANVRQVIWMKCILKKRWFIDTVHIQQLRTIKVCLDKNDGETNVEMHQEEQQRRTLLISKHGCKQYKILSIKWLCNCFMRKEMHRIVNWALSEFRVLTDEPSKTDFNHDLSLSFFFPFCFSFFQFCWRGCVWILFHHEAD